MTGDRNPFIEAKSGQREKEKMSTADEEGDTKKDPLHPVQQMVEGIDSRFRILERKWLEKYGDVPLGWLEVFFREWKRETLALAFGKDWGMQRGGLLFHGDDPEEFSKWVESQSSITPRDLLLEVNGHAAGLPGHGEGLLGGGEMQNFEGWFVQQHITLAMDSCPSLADPQLREFAASMLFLGQALMKAGIPIKNAVEFRQRQSERAKKPRRKGTLQSLLEMIGESDPSTVLSVWRKKRVYGSEMAQIRLYYEPDELKPYGAYWEETNKESYWTEQAIRTAITRRNKKNKR